MAKLLDPTNLTAEDVAALRARCTHFIHGGGPKRVADYLAEIPTDTETDNYGRGGVVAELEAEVAALLGKEAAVFMPTGTMAQQIALRIHADHAGRRGIWFHPACHVDTKELRAYELLHGLAGQPVGEPQRLLALDDLIHHRWYGTPTGERPAVLLLELPQRDIGSQLPSWEDLTAQAAWARDNGVRLHLDGARLWGCEPFYGRSLGEVAALFDTVYVSFYKQLDGLAGCALAGPADLIEEARDWRRRHGGSLYSLWPNAASALAGLRSRLPKMRSHYEHALAVAAALSDLDRLDIVPNPPHVPAFHLLLRRPLPHLQQRAVELARREGLWTFYKLPETDVPDVHRWEVEIGEAASALTPAEIRRAVELLLAD